MLNPRFRIISNGFGEDLIASKLIQSFRDCYDFDFDVFPLVGQGNAYKHIGMNPKLDQNVLPSGGFLLKINDIVSDLKSGLFSQFRKQRHLLKSSISDYQIVVGDVYALFMATFGISIPTIFLPTAKSERAIPHMNIELRYIRSQTDLVFPRDIETHQRLKRAKINSYFFDNPMFDDMHSSVLQPSEFTICLLPGSRNEALKNLNKLLLIIDQLHIKTPVRYIVCLPKHLRYDFLNKVVEDLPWVVKKSDHVSCLFHSQLNITVDVSYQFFDALQASSLVIGLAGTANEQAMFAKRPLISFVGEGPQSTKQRFLQQHQLIDGARCLFIDSKDPFTISTEISNYISNETFEWTSLNDCYQDAASKIRDCICHSLIQPS